MNGRLYDPMLGRFFSPDNYVQMPDFSQSFNRYSYCLNNPLKYTDPSGELFGIDDAVFAFAVFGMANSMMQAAYNGGNIWKAGAISLLSSAASFGIGQAFGNVGGFGKELLRAGAHGLASGVFNALDGGSFGSGFISGAAASGIGSFAQGANMNSGLMVLSTSSMGGFAAWVTGGDFLMGAMQGMQIGMLNHAMHDGEDDIRYFYPNGNYSIMNEDGTLEIVIVGHNYNSFKYDNALVFSSVGITCLEHNYYSKTFNHWRGKNGKLYSGLTGKGPNRYTGPRSLAKAKADKFNRFGKVVGGISIFKSGIKSYNSYYNTGLTLETAVYGVDTAFEAIGTFGGIKGLAINLYYQNIIKEYPAIRMSVELQSIERADMMQRGFIPIGHPGFPFK